MGAMVREVRFLCRAIVRSRVSLLVLAVLAFLVWDGVAGARAGVQLASFGPLTGIAITVASLRPWVLLLAALTAAYRAASVLDRSMLGQAFLDGRRPGGVVVRAAVCSGLLVTAASLILLGEAALLAKLLGRSGLDVRSVGEVVNTVMVVLVLVWVWAVFGAMLGAILNSRLLSVLVVTGVLVVCIVLERTAVLFPGLAPLATVSPLGASSVLVFGGFVPDFPSGRSNPVVAVVALLGWTSVLVLALRHRYSTHQVDAIWQRSHRAPRGTHRWALSSACERVPVAGVLALALVGVGVGVPQYLNQAIPWRYKATWLTSVAQGTTPADTMQAFLTELAAGRDDVAIGYVADGVWPQVQTLRGQLTDPAAHASAFNLLDDSAPGSVILNVGKDQVLSDGSILLLEQIGACLRRNGTGWQIVFLSPIGLTCSSAGF